MSNSTKKWYILFTREGCEKKVANQLTRKNIENYFPLKKEWNTKGKLLIEPLFTSYVFVRLEECTNLSIRSIDGVINFAYWLGKPAVVRNEEIEIMKRFLTEYSAVKTEKIPLNVNGAFRVVGTPLMEQKGQLVSVKNNTVKIVLPSIGFMLITELEKSNLDIINAPKQYFGLIEKLRGQNMTS